MTAVESTKKPCLHKRARHQHGTPLAYLKDRCRCAQCLVAGRRERKAVEYRTISGTHSYVPADRARAHVQQLLGALTVSQIEQRSGVHRTAIRVLIGDFPGRPASRRIANTTEQALLGVQPDRVGVETRGLVDGTGTRRRLRALVALGWPAKHLAQQLGWSSRTTWFLTAPTVDEHEPVRVSTRDAVRRLYDELSLSVPVPSRATTRARNLAAERGWVRPLAWDDESIDDPATVPMPDVADEDLVDEHAIELVLDGQPMTLTGRDLEVAVRRLAEAGVDAATIAGRVHSDERTVRRIRNTEGVRAARRTARMAVAA